MEQQVIYVEKKSGFPWLILGLILALTGGIGFYFWSKSKSTAPALEENGEGAGAAGVDTGTNTWVAFEEANNQSYQTAPEPNVLTDVINTILPSTTFPLGLAKGADLHKVNPYVKDVQQYCNKFAGTSLDVDGAFGKQTEATVLKVFGTKTVSKKQYNEAVAPALGKPTV